MPVIDTNALIEDRVAALRRLHEESGIARAQLDVSGGIDSAVVLGLLARALGPDEIIAVHSCIDSDSSALERAHEVADAFGVRLAVIDLTDYFHRLTDAVRESLAVAGHPAAEIERRVLEDPTVLGSVRSTLRAPVGRAFNRFAGGGIRHGTGNECEDRWLRFYQKGGDGEVDTNPLAMLSKAEVYQLGRALGVPASILRAQPTPDLWGVGEEHNDETEIASVLGVDPGEHTFYGAIDRATGVYVRAGLIERTSRLDDELGGVLFDDGAVERELIGSARESTAFRGIEPALVGPLISAARHMERVTRHKHNPAVPTLGVRSDLVRGGLLTDELPRPGGCAANASIDPPTSGAA